MTRVSHVWGQVGSVASAEGGPVLGSLCWAGGTRGLTAHMSRDQEEGWRSETAFRPNEL